MAKTVKKLVLPPALGSYAFIFKPREAMDPSQKPKYGITLIWPKAEKEKLRPLTEAIVEVARSKWGDQAVAMLKAGKLHNPLRDGDADRPEDKVFKDSVFANASSQNAPGIVDRQTQKVFEDSEAYSGCTFRASVALFAFDKNGKKGVAIGLNNLQVVSKGPRLDGRKPPEEDFKDFVDEPSKDSKAGAVDDLLG